MPGGQVTHTHISTAKLLTPERILEMLSLGAADHSEGNTTEPPDVWWLSDIAFAMISRGKIPFLPQVNG